MAGGFISRALGIMTRTRMQDATLPVPMPSNDRTVIIRRGFPAGDPRGRGDLREDIQSGAPGARLSPGRVQAANRRLSNENPYARRGINVFASQAVRYGITPKFPSSNKRTKKLLEADFKKWVAQADVTGNTDFNGMQLTVAKEVRRMDEVFVRRHIVDDARARELGLDVQVQWEIIKSEQVPFESFVAPNGNSVIDGIEIDRFGLKVAAWVLSRRPGDPALQGTNQKIRLPFLRMTGLAAATGEILQVLAPGSEGYRGRSAIEVARSRLSGFDRYSRALLTRVEVEACFALYVTESDEQADDDGMPRDPGDMDDPIGDLDEFDEALEWIEPGRVQYLKRGQTITASNPQSSGGLEVFARETLRAISIALEIPYEMLTNDLSQVSYVSFKAGQVQFKTDVEIFQWVVMVGQFLAPVIAQWCLVGFLKGKWDRVAPEGMDWGMPRWDSVDPVKDATALLLELSSGIVSLEQAKAERGEDFEQTFDEIARVQKAAKMRGLDGFVPTGIGKAKSAGSEDAAAREDSDAVQSPADAPKAPKASGRAKRVEK